MNTSWECHACNTIYNVHVGRCFCKFKKKNTEYEKWFFAVTENFTGNYEFKLIDDKTDKSFTITPDITGYFESKNEAIEWIIKKLELLKDS